MDYRGTTRDQNLLSMAKRLTVKKACLKCHGVRGIDVPDHLYNSLVADYGEKSFNYHKEDLRGIVSVAIPLQFARQTSISMIITIIISGTIILLILGLIMYAIIIRTTASISRVTHGLKDISEGEGDLTVRLNKNSNDEIGDLVMNFNKFVSEIREMIGAIKEMTNQPGFDRIGNVKFNISFFRWHTKSGRVRRRSECDTGRDGGRHGHNCRKRYRSVNRSIRTG